MQTIQDIIACVPEFQGCIDIQIERIAGLTNSNFRITGNSQHYVLRVSGANTSRLGIDRTHELVALRSASAAGMAPEVVAFLPPEGHLVTRWVTGRHWTSQEFRTPEHVRLLTETVRRIHALPPNGAVFSPFQRVNAFLEVAQGYNVALPSQLNALLVPTQQIKTDQESDSSDWQHMCHNDLVSVNYLYQSVGDTITILDWEFAGLGDIYYDLATVVFTHDSEGPIPPELEQVMLETYFGGVTAFQMRRLQGMKYMLMLFTGMWGLAQHGMQSVGLVPAVEGFDYLEFAEYLFDHVLPELQRMLED